MIEVVLWGHFQGEDPLLLQVLGSYQPRDIAATGLVIDVPADRRVQRVTVNVRDASSVALERPHPSERSRFYADEDIEGSWWVYDAERTHRSTAELLLRDGCRAIPCSDEAEARGRASLLNGIIAPPEARQ